MRVPKPPMLASTASLTPSSSNRLATSTAAVGGPQLLDQTPVGRRDLVPERGLSYCVIRPAGMDGVLA